MKRAYIIHGWGDSPAGSWFPWLTKELEKHGYAVSVPAMPSPSAPTIAEWVGALNKLIRPVPDTETLLIGHSIGCQALLRYVAGLPEAAQVGQMVLVAPWLTLSGIDTADFSVAKMWLETPIDFEEVKTAAPNIATIFSTNDPYVELKENMLRFKEALAPDVMILQNKGHISGFDTPKVLEFPEIFKILHLK